MVEVIGKPIFVMLHVELATDGFNHVLTQVVDDQLLSRNDLVKQGDLVILPLLLKQTAYSDAVEAVFSLFSWVFALFDIVYMVKDATLATEKDMAEWPNFIEYLSPCDPVSLFDEKDKFVRVEFFIDLVETELVGWFGTS